MPRVYLGGKFRCANCPPKFAENGFCDSCRTRFNERQNARYAYRREHKLCTWCGEPAEGDKRYCRKHLDAVKARRDRINGGRAPFRTANIVSKGGVNASLKNT